MPENKNDKTVYAVGVWCIECEIFEDAADFPEGRCWQCGCDHTSHSDATVEGI